MRFVFVFFAFFTFFLQAQDLRLLYVEKGIKPVEKKLDSELEKKEFWDEYIGDRAIEYGYYEDASYLLVSNKSEPDLEVLKIEADSFKSMGKEEAYVGKGRGTKLKEGDLTTPIGAYDIVDKKTKLDDYYGPLALVLSYPNLYDSLQYRDGYGIWIHGVPSKGERPANTRGCVAVENDYMLEIDETIDRDKSIVVISEEKIEPIKKSEIVDIFSEVYKWRNAWKYSDLDEYLRFYDDEDFRRFDGKNFEQFREMKRIIFGRDETKTITFSKFNIAPYPNPEGKNMFRLTFFEYYKSDNFLFEGDKELYIEMRGDKMKILAER
jgi:murein L,D-transpeptidase YafK